MKTYCFDIDGTICNNTYGKYDEAVPFEDRIKKINFLYNQGNKIIYFTARGMGRFDGDVQRVNETFYEFTKQQLDSWGCQYDQIFLGKPSYDYFIDDKAFGDKDFFDMFYTITKEGEII